MYVYHPNSSTGPERCLLCGIRMEAHKIHGAHLSPARTLLRRQVLGGPSLLAQALVQHQRELDLGALLSPEWGHWVRREAGDQGSPVRKLMRLPLDAHVRPRGSPALRLHAVAEVRLHALRRRRGRVRLQGRGHRRKTQKPVARINLRQRIVLLDWATDSSLRGLQLALRAGVRSCHKTAHSTGVLGAALAENPQRREER